MQDNNKAEGKIFDDSTLTTKIWDKVNQFEIADNCKLKKKISDSFMNAGKMSVFLSNLIDDKNFYKFGYKALSDSLKDLFKERDIFTFTPFFRLSEESDESPEKKSQIEFDLVISFNQEAINPEKTLYLEKLKERETQFKNNNNNIVGFYLYRMLLEERCYFFPKEIIIKDIFDYYYFDYKIIDIYQSFLYQTNQYNAYQEIETRLVEDLYLYEGNPALYFTRLSCEESCYYNKKEIEKLSKFEIKAKDTDAVFIRQSIEFNIKYNSLIEEIIDYFEELVNGNTKIKSIIKEYLPEDKKYYIEKIDIFSFEEIIRTLTDENNIDQMRYPDIYKKEFQIILQYITENQKFIFKDSPGLQKDDEDLSKHVKDEIVDIFKNYFHVSLRNKILNSNHLNVVDTYSNFTQNIFTLINKDRIVIMRIFDQEIRNKLCFFMYFKLKPEIDEVEFFNNPIEPQVAIIPINILKEIAFYLIKLEIVDLEKNLENILLISKVLSLIYTKPNIIKISLDLTESVKTTGFYSREDFMEAINLLEIKYKNIKDIIKERKILIEKEQEVNDLKKNSFFNFFKIVFASLQKRMLDKNYNKFVNNLKGEYNKKIQVKDVKDKKYLKQFKKDLNLLRNEETEGENKRISKIIDSLDGDDKKLFSIVYNCLKNRGIVEYQSKRMKTEVFIKENPKDKPQMFVFPASALENLIKFNLFNVNRKSILINEKAKSCFGNSDE